jgi:prolyl 4-hydroxylase
MITKISDFLAQASANHHAEILAEVRKLDGESRFLETIEYLARQVRLHGNLKAKTLLAKRLIFGLGIQPMPAQGLMFLKESVSEGCGEAAAQLSVITALGIYGVKQSWLEAMSLLVQSAANGWLPAQGQLLVLTVQASLNNGVLTGEPDNFDFSTLNQMPDVDEWFVSCEKKYLHRDPDVIAVPGFISKSVCEWLIALSTDYLERAKVYDSAEKTVAVSNTRSNRAAILNLMRTDMVCLLLQAKIAATVSCKINQMEAATILHYGVGEEIKPHYDFIHPKSPDYATQIAASGQRSVTFLAYLNDDYEGGETAFTELNMKYKGKQGDAVFFINTTADHQPDLRTQHAGLPPVSGEKWLLSQFIRQLRVFESAV